MTFLIHVIIFSSDNYQGASGKFFETSFVVEISNDINCGLIKSKINLEVNNFKLNNCPFQCDSKIIIKRIELL